MGTRERDSMMRAVPAVISFLALACGLLLPRVDELYAPGHVAALVLALAVPAAYGWIERNRGRSGDGARRFLFPGMMVLAVLSAVASSMLLALGSVEGSAGDYFRRTVAPGGEINMPPSMTRVWPVIRSEPVMKPRIAEATSAGSHCGSCPPPACSGCPLR